MNETTQGTNAILYFSLLLKIRELGASREFFVLFFLYILLSFLDIIEIRQQAGALAFSPRPSRFCDPHSLPPFLVSWCINWDLNGYSGYLWAGWDWAQKQMQKQGISLGSFHACV